jgi:hypothetical protein
MSIEIYSDLTLEDKGFPRIGSYDKGVQQLKGSALERYCQSKITRDFIEHQLAHVENPILLIQKDHNNTIRGFALLKSGDNVLELVILCAAERRASPLRSGSVPPGTKLLKLTKKIGKNYPQVTLYALEEVVSLYHKFGFQLDGNPRYATDIKKFYEFLNPKDAKGRPLPDHLKPSYEQIHEFLVASPITQFGKNYYEKLNKDGIDAAVVAARENGFFMVWNPHATGGSKRKRKSRKNLKKRTKKNLKKRTKKKTLRKRRRKTRKHRGGALNRNSNKGIRKKPTQQIEPTQNKDVYSMVEFNEGEKPRIVSDVTKKHPNELVYASLDLQNPLYQNVPVINQTQYATVVGTTQGPFKK